MIQNWLLWRNNANNSIDKSSNVINILLNWRSNEKHTFWKLQWTPFCRRLGQFWIVYWKWNLYQVLFKIILELIYLNTILCNHNKCLPYILFSFFFFMYNSFFLLSLNPNFETYRNHRNQPLLVFHQRNDH